MSTRKIAISIVVLMVVSMFTAAIAVAQDMPTIASDKLDYAPGETVMLTGTGWQPSENVHIFVNDDQRQSWSLSSGTYGAPPDPIADGSGAFTYQFQLPTWFVATYTVVATGQVSGQATTRFTDLNVGTYDQCANYDRCQLAGQVIRQLAAR